MSHFAGKKFSFRLVLRFNVSLQTKTRQKKYCITTSGQSDDLLKNKFKLFWHFSGYFCENILYIVRKPESVIKPKKGV